MATFSEGGHSPYTDEFRTEVVDRFRELFDVLGNGITRAASITAKEKGVARSTVVEWAKSQDRMPVPTWHMIYEKDDQIELLRAQVAGLKRRLSEHG